MLPIVFLGTLFLGECLGASRIETAIYEGPQGSVVLRTVPETSYRLSHPADVPVETFERVLTGIHYRRSPNRWLQRLLDSGTPSSPLISPDQVAFLAPHLRHAFLQVTADEQVFIRIPLPSTPDFQHLTGILSFEHHDLHMALTLPGLSGLGPRSKTKPRTPEALGVTKPTLVFLPKNAVKTSWDQNTGTNLTIDMALLATPDRSVSKNSPKSPAKSETTPRPIVPKVMPQVTPPQQLEPSPPSDSLREEIRALRRELSKQRQEIERLKKQRETP